MVKTLTSNAGGVSSIPGKGEVGETRSRASGLKKKKKKRKQNHHPKLKTKATFYQIQDSENDPHLK